MTDLCGAEHGGYSGAFGIYCGLPDNHNGPHDDGIIVWQRKDREPGRELETFGWKLIGPDEASRIMRSWEAGTWRILHQTYGATIGALLFQHCSGVQLLPIADSVDWAHADSSLTWDPADL